jgi:formylglycine-generating enzyme required for sulfatase activity
MIKQKFKNFDLIEVSEDSGFERHNLVKLISGWFYHDETIPKTIMNPYDGKEMILVPDGSFALRKGISPSDPGYNGGPRTVFNLPAFYIDRFPVTNREYMRFCKVTGHLKPPAWDTSRYPHRLEQHPVCGVNWMDALAYAGWSHKEIPLASQWEKAAYGEKGTDFPWGSSFDASYCNCAASETRGTTTVNHHSPEGDSMYGIADIVGNVWEWVYDWKSSPHNRMLMGGAWDTPVEFLVRPYYARIYANPGLSGANFGFRLCVSPDTALNWLPKRGEN